MIKFYKRTFVKSQISPIVSQWGENRTIITIKNSRNYVMPIETDRHVRWTIACT